jgi:CsoR family transcriptional regulator, copper-sensing transcriptional repressor
MNDHEAVLKRLKNVAGHINGIITMVEQDRYCIDVIKQIQASQAALAKVSQIILDNHLHTCLTTAIRGEDLAERERVLSEISEVFSTVNQ